jgi:Zn-dependent peptidase ImmA (M78 family)/DNA-binding XRE family transcriptional regulator
MTTHNFKGDRLKSARIYRSMTLTDLAAKTSLTKQALSQYENGTTTPSDSNLFALAAALSFPVEYFSTTGRYTVRSEAAYFRSLMSTNKKDRLAQTVRLEFIAQIYETLFDYIDFPQLRLPTVSFTDAPVRDEAGEADEAAQLEQIAEQVREFWGVGKEPIKDIRYLLEENGIVITCASLNADKIDAFSQRTIINNGEVFFIVISKGKQSIVRARFDMAHELAHILLHPWSEDLESISREEFKARERQANALASAFLLPKDTFGHDIAHYPTNLEYYLHLKNKWNVSVKAMIYRAHRLGAITSSQYQYIMRQYSKNGWNGGEPDDQQYAPKSTLLQSAVEMLFSENILTVDSFLTTLRMRGIILEPLEIEDLLCLKAGTLKPPAPMRPRLLQIRRADAEKED